MKKIKIYSYLSILVGALSFSMLVSTFALYKTVENQNILVDISGDLTKLFIVDNNGKIDNAATPGDGSELHPYIIDNEYELKTLSKITNMGLSSKTDYFKLGADISLQSQMAPIGNEQTPFYSTFDGDGHTISFTNGGEIVGVDVSDVGFFGFVSNGATIKNFILDAPIVSVLKTDKMTYSIGQYTSKLLDLNPLRNVFAGKEIVLSLDSITDEDTLKAGLGAGKTFTLSLANLPTGYTYNVISNNPDILSLTSTNDTTYTFQVANDLSAYTENSYYFTIEINTNGIVNIGTASSPDYRIASYMVERIKFCLENQAIVIKSDYSRTYKRILNPGSLKSGTNANGDIYTNNNHITYAGLVAGHLEGVAEYIGVKNESFIKANGKPFRSNSLLIGRRIEDDNNSSLSREYFDPNGFVNDLQYTKLTTSNYYSSTDEGFTNSSYPNYIAKGIYKAKGGSVNDNKEEQIKLFGNPNGTNHGFNLTNTTYKIASSEEIDGSKSQKIIRINDGFDSSIYEETASGWTTINGSRYCSLTNAIGVWCSTADTSGGGFFQSLLSSQNFYATLEFDYCLFVDDKNSYDDDMLQIGIWAFGKRAKNSSFLWVKYYFFQSDANGDTTKANSTVINQYNYSSKYGSIVDENDVAYTASTITNSDINFKKADIADTIANSSSSTNKYDVKHKKIRFKADLLGLSSGVFAGDNKYSPYLCFGIYDSNMNSMNYQLDITDLTITFSDSKGNYEAGPLTVDYLTSTTSASYASGTWSNWDSYSSTRVGVNMISTSTEEVSSGKGGTNGSNLPYIEVIPSNYFVSANRTVLNSSYSNSKFVEITYHDDSNSYTGSGAYLIPISIEGFTEPISISAV